ncbi:MAG: hypothetical protein ACE5GW_11715, partial [Planctomycetota bacterium]
MAKAPQRRKSAGNGRGSRPAKTPKRTIARPPRQVSETSTEGYEIICSECYSSFMMSRNPSASQVTCPDCLHVGSIAPREEMTKISIAKSAEKSNLRLAAIPALLFFLCGVTYVALLNAKGG